MSRRLILFIAIAAVVSSLVLIGIHKSNAQNAKRAKRVPLTVLQSSKAPINSEYTKRTVLAPSKDGQSIYSLDTMTGELFVYDRKSKQLRKAADSLSNAEAFTVGPQGDLYLAQSDSTVQIVNSQGRRLKRFPTVYPRSIAVLGNGNVVVASPFDGKLLHLYSSQGVFLGRFGELRMFDSDPVQNEFLNWGKVIVGSGDQIYFVSTYAPEPFVLKFSSEGQLFGEFQIEGDAVDFQTDLTKDFLSRRRLDQSGGVTIITAATVNPDTGHLWLGMNGLSTHGTIYEYDETGTKLREYALLLNSNNKRHNVTHVKDIAVSSDSLEVLTWGGTYSLQLSDVLVDDAYAIPRKNSRTVKSAWHSWANPFSKIMESWKAAPIPVHAIPQQGTCGQAQAITCTANCPAGTTPSSVDCGAETASLLGDRIPTSAVCTMKPIDSTPASSTPGGCTETVTFCNSANGATGSLTATLNCNAVPTPTPTPTPEPSPSPSPTPTPPGGGGDPCEATNRDGSSRVCGSTPVLIDVLGNGFDLTDVSRGVRFDLNIDGARENLSWTTAGSDDAWLALDRDGNGTIDNGSELFGNYTPQSEPTAGEERNGFLALAEFDKPANGGNSDGKIEQSDAVFSSLRLWQDTNHNGISEPSELRTLPQLGIATIDLKYKESKRTDQYGNQFRYRSKVKDAHGAQAGRWAWDVFLITGP